MSRCLGNVVGGVYDVPGPVGEVRVAIVVAGCLEPLRSFTHLAEGHLNPLRWLLLQVCVCEREIEREGEKEREREREIRVSYIVRSE